MAKSSVTLTDQDRADWAAYARLVTAFEGRAVPPPAPAPCVVAPPVARPAPPAAPPAPKTRLGAVTTGQHPPGLDKSTWERLRGGKMAPTRTLDLHGKTVQAAFAALERFLLTAHAEKIRCVEVITGRGAGERGGAIRRELPLWLNLPSVRPLILAVTHPHALNTGSVRILLRQQRRKNGPS